MWTRSVPFSSGLTVKILLLPQYLARWPAEYLILLKWKALWDGSPSARPSYVMGLSRQGLNYWVSWSHVYVLCCFVIFQFLSLDLCFRNPPLGGRSGLFISRWNRNRGVQRLLFFQARALTLAPNSLKLFFFFPENLRNLIAVFACSKSENWGRNTIRRMLKMSISIC